MRAPFSAYDSKRMVRAFAGTGVTGMAGTVTTLGGVVVPGQVRVEAVGAVPEPGSARPWPGTVVMIVGRGVVRVVVGRCRVTLTTGRATGSGSSARPDAAQKPMPMGTSTPTTIAATCHPWRRPPSERLAAAGSVMVRSRSETGNVLGAPGGADGADGAGWVGSPARCGTQLVGDDCSRPKVVPYAVSSSGADASDGRSAGSHRRSVESSRVVSRVGSGRYGGMSDTGSPRLVCRLVTSGAGAGGCPRSVTSAVGGRHAARRVRATRRVPAYTLHCTVPEPDVTVAEIFSPAGCWSRCTSSACGVLPSHVSIGASPTVVSTWASTPAAAGPVADTISTRTVAAPTGTGDTFGVPPSIGAKVVVAVTSWAQTPGAESAGGPMPLSPVPPHEPQSDIPGPAPV